MATRILYIEDNSAIRERVAETLRESGFETIEATTARDARKAFADGNFDLALLDVLLPDGNGLDLLRELRAQLRSRVPVIILSALGEIDERVSGLDAGANDYLPKPFSTRELIARIRAVMRAAAPESDAAANSFFRLDGGRLDLQQPFVIRDDGTQIALSMKEFCLMRYFAENSGRTISVEEILSHVWKLNPAKTDTASPAVFISRLRRKLGGLCRIEGSRGTGFRLETLRN